MVVLIAEGVACPSGHPTGNHQYSLAVIHKPHPRFVLIISFINHVPELIKFMPFIPSS